MGTALKPRPKPYFLPTEARETFFREPGKPESSLTLWPAQRELRVFVLALTNHVTGSRVCISQALF